MNDNDLVTVRAGRRGEQQFSFLSWHSVIVSANLSRTLIDSILSSHILIRFLIAANVLWQMLLELPLYQNVSVYNAAKQTCVVLLKMLTLLRS